MSQSISVTFRYSEEEYVKATRIYYSKALKLKFDIFLCISMIIVGSFFSVKYGYSAIWMFAIFAGIGFLGFLYYAFNILPKTRFRQEPKFHNDYTLVFSEDGIDFKTDHLDSKVEWSYYKYVWESNEFYQIFYGKGLYTLVPKRIFQSSDEEKLFRHMLESKISPTFEQVN
jgi:hypothetical protein